MKRIVVSIVTYNQEDFIGRALDSVLQQKEWGLYRIIVSDDCSSDRTWEILQEYKVRFPELLCIYRNEHNLGVYQNFEKTDTYLPDSDLYASLSGDDAYCDGYFEAVQKLIIEKQIDTNDAVGIYSDWKVVTPDGTENVHCQDRALSGYSAWELKIRSIITNRSLIVTKKVREGVKPTILDKGLRVAESIYDVQLPLNIKKIYYFHQTTTIYYSGIGVSKFLTIKGSDYHTTQGVAKWNHFIDLYIQNKRDLNYAKYEIKKAEFYMQPTWKKYIQIFYYYNKGLLPKCRPTYKETLFIFWHLMKYKFDF